MLSQSNTNIITVGQYQVNSNAALYISDQVLGFTASGLKPNTRLSIFFDGVNVTTDCSPATYNQALTTVKSSDYLALAATGSVLVSDVNGSFIGIFNVPKSTFQVGTRELHIFDFTSTSDTYDGKTSSHSCEAFAYFMAFNASSTDAENTAIISTIPSGSTTSVTLSNRGSGTPTSIDPNNPRFDPMCQSFYVGSDATESQDGAFIKYIDLFFATVSATQPITLDMRTIENGVPTTTIIPYSTVTLQASQTVADPTGQTATRFTFDSPVYLRSGYSYAFGLMPAGQVPDYTIWTSVVGDADIVNGTADGSWGTGTLFTSSTGSVWTPIPNQTLKFNMAREDFTSTSGTVTFVNDDYEFIKFSNTSIANFNVGEYVYQMPHPLAGYVSVNTTSNTISYNVNASASLSCNLALEFAVNDHILVVGSIPTLGGLNSGVFANAFTAKVTSINAGNNTLQFAYANGANASGAPFANGTSIFYKPAKGTVSITAGSQSVVGVGTRFDQQYSNTTPLVLQWSNGSVSGNEILWPASIINSTSMTTVNAPFTTNAIAIPLTVPVGRVSAIDYNRNLLILDSSTANSSSNNSAWANIFAATSYFASSRILVGSESGATALISTIVNVPVNSVQPIVYQASVQGTSVSYSANVINTSYVPVNVESVSTSDTNYFTEAELIVASKSNEINYNNGSKSFNLIGTLTSNSDMISPAIDDAHLTMLVKTNVINSDASNEYGPNGTALSKYISAPIILGDGNDAEDLTVYLTAYRPATTDIKVYARLLNASDSDSLNDKAWTELVPFSPNLYSDTKNQADYQEFQFNLPIDPSTILGTDLVTTNNSSTITSTSGNTSWYSLYSNGDLVTVYSDAGMLNYNVKTISSVSNTSITFTSNVGISNTSSALLGSMIYPNAGFKNSLNDNIVTYYDDLGVEYDSYLSYAIKVVMLATTSNLVPKIDNIRALALSV
jgi:hypothetical protein